ncbi:fused DSP-PTPase phosphatase/NAD kinase-like protein [Telmatospirillum sp.]|uniref:fused DSP-PTPase phosphatase/NAD kinase-like protein n=1 Tax=Telmatospirillum sp. TaxID=2079197 RepID=UPI00283B0584|nr:sulfur transferase domain-containing protein [Telmatospirillum sp.]MDR3439447.1 tyrosine-protein phosphatase [Telmatospirillum sp.]
MDLPTLAKPCRELTGRERLRAYVDLWLVDHGFIRDIYCNRHLVSEGVWRSAQPAPHHLRWAKRHGIRTILNLRGCRENDGTYLLEREECQRLGLTLIDFPIRSRSPLDPATLRAAAQVFDEIEYPVLLHCKSGADRAGFMSTLYLFLRQGVPLRVAMKKHLSLAYGHLKHAKTGVIDFFFNRFLAESDGSPKAFLVWLDNRYDRDALEAQFKENWLAGLLINFVLRRE